MLPLIGAALALVAAAPDPGADRAAIHKLLTDYGATLDRGDLDGFGRLFARDGVYSAGRGGEAKGGVAIATMMRREFADNALGFRGPGHHLFFNEVVTLDDADHAHATSLSLYVVPDEASRPAPALMAAYDDQLVREGGAWKFGRRTVSSLIPAPAKR